MISGQVSIVTESVEMTVAKSCNRMKRRRSSENSLQSEMQTEGQEGSNKVTFRLPGVYASKMPTFMLNLLTIVLDQKLLIPRIFSGLKAEYLALKCR